MADLRFDGQTVVVTGAGQGLGKAYALYYASRGANVVVNDLGSTVKGVGQDGKIADSVVKVIRAAGGNAVASYESVQNGDKIIQTANDQFGRVDILVNNAGILRDVSFKNMKEDDWNAVLSVHLDGAYRTTRAAWPHFRKQRFGRIINTTSPTGLFGNFGQVNYGAAKMALVGLTEALAKEGEKYNITCNVVSPMAASRMTATVMKTQDGEKSPFDPAAVVPLVAFLTHKSCSETGAIFDAGAGHFSKIRWQRSRGALLRPDSSYTPGAILAKWADVHDWKQAEAPRGPPNLLEILEQGSKLGQNSSSGEPDYSGKVVVVTGAGAGIGRAYALYFAGLGASVVANDLANVDDTVNVIKLSGGMAVASNVSVLDGPALIRTALDAFGKVDVLVNNAGILRDKSFHNISDKQWKDVVDVHLHGTYSCIKAAWPVMSGQKYGRIINTTSPSGIYGSFGQANYSAAKAGIIGMTRSLAIEGQKNNILVNAIAPTAGTQMTATIMPPEVLEKLKPEYICPLVALLGSEKAPSTGSIFEAGCGWQAELRWQRSGGITFSDRSKLTAEAIAKDFASLINFDDGRANYPSSQADARKNVSANTLPISEAATQHENKWLAAIEKAMAATPQSTPFDYDKRDTILYNLSVGAKRHQGEFVFEGDPNFQLIPTYGVIPYFGAKRPFEVGEIVPNFKPVRLLHGEQYLEIRKWPPPVEAKTVSEKRLLEVIDKGNAALVVTGTVTKDATTGEDLFYNEETVFIRGSGGFGGPKKGKDRGPATTTYTAPARAPDAVFEDKTSEEQAAWYRLNGDWNPLHVDFASAKKGGFDFPILHGLCSLGITGRRIAEKYRPIKNIKVRFTGVVIPGQTLKVELWKHKYTVIFQTTVVETGKAVVSGAAQLRDLSSKLS